MSEGTGGRRRAPWLLLIALVAALALAVVLATRGGGASDAASTGGGDADADAPSTQAIAERDGLVLTGVQLTTVQDGIDPATGLPTAERERYDVGEGARLWVRFTYDGANAGRDSLVVVWFRDGEEIFRSSWRLPQPVENQNVALGASYTEIAGDYRVEVRLNDEVLHSTNFEVG